MKKSSIFELVSFGGIKCQDTWGKITRLWNFWKEKLGKIGAEDGWA